MSELKNTELENVAGGVEDREINIRVKLPLPFPRTASLIVTVYIDGNYKSSMTKTVDASVSETYLDFKGTHGNVNVVVKLNNAYYKNYYIDFNTHTYSEI